MTLKRSLLFFPACFCCVLLFEPAVAQDAVNPDGFYDIQIAKDEIYRYTNLRFKGDFISFESPSGMLALGRTSAGVTLVIVLGGGTVHLEVPENVQEKFKSVFGAHPFDGKFKTAYLRLNPRDYDAAFGKVELTRTGDEAALKQAQEVFAERFNLSYHAGPKAILPRPRTRVIELDVEGHGLVCTEESYWLKLNRMSPFAKVYPTEYVNPRK